MKRVLANGRRVARRQHGSAGRDVRALPQSRIRDIRSLERRFYQKVLDIYATSVDYMPDTEQSQQFFATVQNKMHWAAHGHTAAGIIAVRADAAKLFMGLQTNWSILTRRRGERGERGGRKHEMLG
jgi:hypothetical protein